MQKTKVKAVANRKIKQPIFLLMKKNKIAHQAGLGRDRIADIEDSGGLSGREDYAGGDNDEMNSQNRRSETGG